MPMLVVANKIFLIYQKVKHLLKVNPMSNNLLWLLLQESQLLLIFPTVLAESFYGIRKE